MDFKKFFEFVHRTGYENTFTVEATAFDGEGVIDIEMLNEQFKYIREAMG